jgi:hypothetical protein
LGLIDKKLDSEVIWNNASSCIATKPQYLVFVKAKIYVNDVFVKAISGFVEY